ncbi:nucleotidyltransferase family protein [Altererythrobacter sp. KTW20L]|uniref:nucleotidyltransferase family protein n=1 Tax=Altererythrobacter sp. KTW20L TaxID=2942210 RepID=UPI0020BD4B2E|nr:nucleotidyltransferase family protein [Altererythrobacter sp. KTW20L]MCL6249681.1 nucleotidyltransferase family protein [Altererythrobacter sp. KTW20L]
MPCCVPPANAPLVAVLAAGAATRFGGGKLDAVLAGKPVGQWTLEAVNAAGLDPGLIVVGSDAPQFARDSGWPLLVNAQAEHGLGTSLALAATQAMVQGRALLVVLADMPLVDPSHLAQLAQAKTITATGWPQGRAGVPACFPLGILPEVAQLSGDTGAGALLTGRAGLRLVEAAPQMLLDVDTPEDLASVEQWLRRG